MSLPRGVFGCHSRAMRVWEPSLIDRQTERLRGHGVRGIDRPVLSGGTAPDKAAPDWGAVLHHMVIPHLSAGSTLVAVGVLGAVVMPHNMYLHSEIIQNREWKGRSDAETRRLLHHVIHNTQKRDKPKPGNRPA